MGIELPAELVEVAAKAGVTWPKADEDAMRSAAAAWREAGTKLAALAGESDGAAGKALSGLSGAAGEAARRHWTTFTAPDGKLDEAVRGCHAAADRLDHAAQQVGAAKVELVRELVNLAKNNDAANQAAAAGHPTALLGLDTAVRGAAANVAHLTDTLTQAVRLDSGVQVGGRPLLDVNPGVHGPSHDAPGNQDGSGGQGGSGGSGGHGGPGGPADGRGQGVGGLLGAVLDGGQSQAGQAQGPVPAHAQSGHAAPGQAVPGQAAGGQGGGLLGNVVGAVTAPVAAVVDPVLDTTGQVVHDAVHTVEKAAQGTVHGVDRAVDNAADAVRGGGGGEGGGGGGGGHGRDGAPGRGPGADHAPGPANQVVAPAAGAGPAIVQPVVESVGRAADTVTQSSAAILDRPLLPTEAPHAPAPQQPAAQGPNAHQPPGFGGAGGGLSSGPVAGGAASGPVAAGTAAAQSAAAAVQGQAGQAQSGQQAARGAQVAAQPTAAGQGVAGQGTAGQGGAGQTAAGQGASGQGAGQGGAGQSQGGQGNQAAKDATQAQSQAKDPAQATQPKDAQLKDAQPKDPQTGQAKDAGQAKDPAKDLAKAAEQAAFGLAVLPLARDVVTRGGSGQGFLPGWVPGQNLGPGTPASNGPYGYVGTGQGYAAGGLPFGAVSGVLGTGPAVPVELPGLPQKPGRTAEPGDESVELFLLHMFPGGTLPPARRAPARQLPTPSEEQGFASGLRFEPQGHPDGHLVDDTARPLPGFAHGPGAAPDPALVEGYDPLAGMHERDWDRRFLVRADPPEYAWPPGELFPEGGYEAGQPGVLAVGVDLDRFGTPEGRVLSELGTPFRERSLPPAALDAGYHRYRVARELPVWFTLSAEWFGQPGGGVRYRTTHPVAELVALGYLEEVR